MPLNHAALERYLDKVLPTSVYRPRVPIMTAEYSGYGYGAFEFGYLVKSFFGPNSRSDANKFAADLLSDMRYEFGRG